MKAINEIRPGMTGAEADAISSNYLESKGYGKRIWTFTRTWYWFKLMKGQCWLVRYKINFKLTTVLQ